MHAEVKNCIVVMTRSPPTTQRVVRRQGGDLKGCGSRAGYEILFARSQLLFQLILYKHHRVDVRDGQVGFMQLGGER